MKKTLEILSIIGICIINNAYAKEFIKVEYTPLSKEECLSQKKTLGLKYCPHDDDYLAGAAKACGKLKNLPTGNDLHNLARKIYNKKTNDTSIYGNRDDKLMRDMNIWQNYSRIYFWVGEEANDEIGGYVRMFAREGSIPYYAPRDGSGYVSHAVGKISYSNDDVLVTVCYK